MDLAGAYAARAADDPSRVAIRGVDRAWTRGELALAIDATATRLRAGHGVVAGDRIAYLGANRVEELVLLFALARLGAMLVPLNTRLAVAELAALVAHAEPRLLVVDDDFAAIGAELGIVVRQVAEVVATTGAACSTEVDPDTPVLIAYTSGTTGTPKGAVHTQAGLLANAAASVAAHDLVADDRVLTVLPLFHVGGLCIQTVPALLAGAEVWLHPRFDAGAWLDAVATWRPTLSLMVPATLRAALAHPAWSTTDLSCLRVLMAGSSIIPRALIDAVHARGVPLGQVYGATETGPVTAVLRAGDAMARVGTTGWPCFPDSLRLLDASGADVVGDAVGEIHVRAPNIMRGYWRLPADTGFRQHDDADWFATGDLARRAPDGCLEVVGRSRDLIISGGENIHPAELEDVLAAIPGVAEAAVVGVPDERWNEVPAAFVVRRADAMLDEATVASAFVDRLARFKHPKHVVFVDALPRNAMGKVLTGALRKLVIT